jgi:hypothetical protein
MQRLNKAVGLGVWQRERESGLSQTRSLVIREPEEEMIGSLFSLVMPRENHYAEPFVASYPN